MPLRKETYPLENVRVVDLTHYEAGPSCTLLLAFLGAEVIKIEHPVYGKSQRHLFHDEEANDDLYFVLMNLNKKSITLNLETDEGRAVFHTLTSKSDVLVENFGTGKMKTWGICEERLMEYHPRLIYASVSGYGSYGSHVPYPALDMTAQAMGGIMSMTGNKDQEPLRCGANVGDSSGGTNLALAVVAALYRREKTGKGGRVEVSLQDSVVNLGRSLLGTHIAFGSNARKEGNELTDIVPWNIYRSGDNGYVAICVIKQKTFEKLMKVIGHEDLIDRYGLYSLRKRKENRLIIEKFLSEWVSRRTKKDVMEILCGHTIPCGIVQNTLEISDDCHLHNREMIVEIDHYHWGKIKVLGCPVKVSGKTAPIASSPRMGQHNREVYRELLGFSTEDIHAMERKKII